MWAGLVLILAMIQVALLWRRFYYGNDDLLQFQVAQRAGLSWEMLTLNVFQHFAPYNRLGHLLVSLTGMSPVAGLAFMTLNLVALLFCCLWFMTELGLSSGRRVLALVLIGLSVSVSESGIWFDTSMHIMPALAVTIAVCAAHVRGVRTGSRRWHVVALVLFVGGQLFQERPIFALPLAVLADVLLLWRTVPWGERLRRLWAIRWPIVSLVLAAGAIAAWLQAFVVKEGGTTPSWETTGRTMLMALTDYVLPSLVNLPLSAPSSWASQLGIVLAAVVVGIFVALVRRRNAGPVLFAAAVFVLYYGFLKLSPLLIDTPASVVRNAERLHYAVYVTVPLVIALVSLEPPTRLGARGRWPGRLAVLGALALAAYLAVAGNAYLARHWAGTTEARAYIDAVRANAQEWSSPDVSLVPLSAPPAMSTFWSRPLGRHDELLGLIVKDFELQDLGVRPVIIDGQGVVRPAALVPVPGQISIVSGACGARDTDGRTAFRAEAHVAETRAPAYLVVSYRSAEPTTVDVVTDPDSARGVGFSQIDLPAGERTRVVPLDDPDVRDLVASGSGLCVVDFDVVRAADVDSGVCRYVDPYGRPGARVACP